MYLARQAYIGKYNQITVVVNIKRIATNRVFPIMQGLIKYFFFPKRGWGPMFEGVIPIISMSLNFKNSRWVRPLLRCK